MPQEIRVLIASESGNEKKSEIIQRDVPSKPFPNPPMRPYLFSRSCPPSAGGKLKSSTEELEQVLKKYVQYKMTVLHYT